MSIGGASAKIQAVVMQWQDVTTIPHRFGGTEFRVGPCEIGHIHGNDVVDIPFPKRVRDQLIATNRAEPHHILPDTSWVSCFLLCENDIDRTLDILKLAYDLAVEKIPARAELEQA